MVLCLPLAILLGFLLAQPLELETLAVVVLVIAVLSVPLLMAWYHPLVILSWNAIVYFTFLPGQPELWMLMAVLALFFAALNRSVDSDRRFIIVPELTRSLLFLVGVVLVTALMTGGLGMRIFGGDRYGGRKYFYLFMAVAGYFAFCSQKIPKERANLFVAFFFLSSLTGLISSLANAGGPGFYFLFNFFPPAGILDNPDAVVSQDYGIARIGWLGSVAISGASFILARYGIRGVLDLSRPWRLLLFLAAIVASLACGYRSNLILLLLIFGVLFVVEGLHRTRLLAGAAACFVLCLCFLLSFAERLPPVVQRTMSFLPIKVDPVVEVEAIASTEWRVGMWKSVLPLVPQYFFKGKGYGLDANDLFLTGESSYRHLDDPFAGSRLAGDYHNGPLTVIIPFGIWGVIGFGWFVIASIRTMHRYCKFGDPELQKINRLLFAMFSAKVIFFLFVFGSLSSDLFTFTGLTGLAVSLNGLPRKSIEQEQQIPGGAGEAFS